MSLGVAVKPDIRVSLHDVALSPKRRRSRFYRSHGVILRSPGGERCVGKICGEAPMSSIGAALEGWAAGGSYSRAAVAAGQRASAASGRSSSCSCCSGRRSGRACGQSNRKQGDGSNAFHRFDPHPELFWFSRPLTARLKVSRQGAATKLAIAVPKEGSVTELI